MATSERTRLRVPGAELSYELSGSGPLLLLLQGGDGTIARAAGLARKLAEHYTVLVHDRRGLGGSTATDPSARATPHTHAADVHHLLAALTTDPALILASSLGALIGLTLAAAHPGQVHTLVAHDPALIRLLPPGERARADADLRRLEQLHRAEGLAAARRLLGELVHADLTDREPDALLTPGNPADLAHFLTHDLPEIRTATLDAADIRARTDIRIVPAAGRGSRATWNYGCARALATLLGTEVTEFPGGHSLSTHPAAFAARLRETLAA